ncbi:DNA polymerase ligase N-terminal domain-containing protein [Streptomyces oceani]|uniref:3'-phosphoesterase n=1 Tax=Streptomyces oceani TaxID=1075402 RepID=A0A1E7KJF0_9ACTN|nr:DNA polymerase ligase N-terminal domain-containing protein [Streptomyces oceani]OEV04122.1 3'-phosphoesterase [Streptomyces oceani]
MSRSDKLRTYREKRHFDRTREPAGGAGAEWPESGSEPVFVVQIHRASTTHFDFRLEVDGVLKSWAVPKGPSATPGDKRLAMPTEDHPLEYRKFEGVIAEGEYGAGTVLVWDEGAYEPLTHDRRKRPVPFARGLAAGHVSFWLDGHKLRGGYSLTRFRGGEGNGDGEREAWLLVKRDDERTATRGAPEPTRARSARTGRTLHQVAAQEEPIRPAEEW